MISCLMASVFLRRILTLNNLLYMLVIYSLLTFNLLSSQPADRNQFIPLTMIFVGANTCEACKAFFRRSIGNEASIKPCTKGGHCAENPNGKISCSDCRHKKCLAIGMAREGMVPKSSPVYNLLYLWRKR